MGKLVNRKLRELTNDDVHKIADTYQNWRSKDNYEDYLDEPGFCKSVSAINEIIEHDYAITPGRYVGYPLLEEDGQSLREKLEVLTSELGEEFRKSRLIQEEIQKKLEDYSFEF
jgi:type I restriction enzyme M protein